jgi:NADH:ubiquinone oxidoreductase subunit F (NADH-binding)
MEGMPHRLLEGAIIAAYASGAGAAYAYVNAEADLSAGRLQAAIDKAYESGLLGDDILGSGFALDVEIRRGAGGYVCGDETTLLNTMEGRRREPRIKPPLPIESGLWGKPTVINNAETLTSVPFIMAEGASAFMDIGANGDAGTKLISLSGAVRRPGLVEVPMGTTLREIIFDLGGGPGNGRGISAMAVGGPSSGVLPASMLDTPIAPGPLHESGVILGAGGVVALGDEADVIAVVRHLAEYNADESCGKCTPCREGTPRIVDALDRLIDGQGSAADLEELRRLSEVVELASLCGLGQAAGNPVNSALHLFPDEMSALGNRRDS